MGASPADNFYTAAARRDPAIRRQNKIELSALAFHLWCMTREERAEVTVESLRAKRSGLLHGYIADAEIQAVIDAENNRVWHDPLLGEAA